VLIQSLRDEFNLPDGHAPRTGELSCCGFSNEILAVGTTGSEFNNTVELKPMKYDEAMGRPDRQEWNEAVEAEHERFKKHQVWKPVGMKFLQTQKSYPQHGQ
jgi:hypothetical protein